MENKTVVVANKEGVALLGTHFHLLTDESSTTFETNSFVDFIQYIQMVRIKNKDFGIFFNNKQVVAISLLPSYNNKPIATCSLNTSTPLSWVESLTSSGMVKLSDLELVLYKLRNYFDGTAAKMLFDRTREFKLEKITRVEMKKDNQGNYMYSVVRKGSPEDVEPIERISFRLPVFDGMKLPEHEIEIDLDCMMEFKEIEGSVIIGFRFLNPELQDIIRNRMIEIIRDSLKPVDNLPKFWGSMECNNKTDLWRYSPNPIKS